VHSFTGSAGQAIVSKTTAYLVTDSRYWLQAQDELDENWHVITAGFIDGPKDWIDWLVVSTAPPISYFSSADASSFHHQDRVKDSRIGVDARMLAHEKAVLLNTQLTAKNSKLIYPPQNFVDLIWKDKPPRSKEPIFMQPMEFTGKEASAKLAELRDWIKQQPPATLSYSKAPATPAQMHVATLITSLSSIGTFHFPLD
jgi:Xaa-Pro aminopeptidase